MLRVIVINMNDRLEKLLKEFIITEVPNSLEVSLSIGDKTIYVSMYDISIPKMKNIYTGETKKITVTCDHGFEHVMEEKIAESVSITNEDYNKHLERVIKNLETYKRQLI